MNDYFTKKKKITYSKIFILFVVFLIFITPTADSVRMRTKGLYLISINDTPLGLVSTKEAAENAINEAKNLICIESNNTILAEIEFAINKQDDKRNYKKYSQKAMETLIYKKIKSNYSNLKQQSYTIKINNFTVSLGSKEEVLDVLNAVQNPYNDNNRFEVVLIDNNNSTVPSMYVDIRAKKTTVNQSSGNTVLAAGTDNVLIDLDFEENIQIIETYVDTAKIVNKQTALEAVTKQKERNTIYEVQYGDCLSVVAEKNHTTTKKIIENNPNLLTNQYIHPGDEIIVTVPKPELSIIEKTSSSYKENYDADIVYSDDNTMYIGEYKTLSEGKQGERFVTAIINSKNGVEIGREIISENILVPAIAKHVARGTQIPPTYIRPLSGGIFSSGFKYRWGRMHKGIDWSCSIGTTIRASRAGTVLNAGWNGSYGYSITISHGNGVKTRYAHLSKILVQTGQVIEQGEKIALSGNTGNSTGPHLHFEVIVGGTQVNPLNYLTGY